MDPNMGMFIDFVNVGIRIGFVEVMHRDPVLTVSLDW